MAKIRTMESMKSIWSLWKKEEEPIALPPATDDEALAMLYATPPEKPAAKAPADIPAPKNSGGPDAAVMFSNAIKLETVRDTLFMEFHVFNGDSGKKLLDKTRPQAKIAMESETAKQLLMTLADLFQCELAPKG